MTQNTRNNGTSYERLTQQLFQAIIDQDVVPNIQVKNNVHMQGDRTGHQIDIYWEFQVGNIKYKNVVEVKDWSRPVNQGEVMKFKAMLDDLPDQPRGIIVARTGFQEGARRLARTSGIVLYELREPTEVDLEGRMRGVEFTLASYHSSTTDIQLMHDEGWRISESVRLGLEEAPRLVFSMEPDDTQLFDELGAQLGTVKQITDSCYPDCIQQLEPTRVRHEFDKPTFVATGHPDFPKLKLTAIEATIATQNLVHEIAINVAELVRCILRDTLNGTVRTFDRRFFERNAIEY